MKILRRRFGTNRSAHPLPPFMKAPFLFLISLTSLPLFVLGQGSLTPSGTPGPAMKSLDQIEARTPISSLPFTISTGGSYYLTKSLSVTTGNAITITVDNVNVDLNGFTISSTASPAAGNAITLSGSRKNLRITNGNIAGSVAFSAGSYTGAGFANGIVSSGGSSSTTTVSFVNVSGLMAEGISLGLGTSATLVDACNVSTVGGDGIIAVTVSNSTAAQCGLSAITGHSVSSSRGDSTLSGSGIDGTVTRDSYGTSNSGDGIDAVVAENCYGSSQTGNGINASNAVSNSNAVSSGNNAAIFTGGSALNCFGTANGNAYAVDAYNAENCYGTALGTGNGVFANSNALNCTGFAASTGTGVMAAGTAQSCFGQSAQGIGVQGAAASNCYGTTSGTFGSGVTAGVFATIAQNCRGISNSSTPGSGSGVFAADAMNCSGTAAHSNQAGGFGVFCGGTAFACDGGTAVSGGTTFFCRPTSGYP